MDEFERVLDAVDDGMENEEAMDAVKNLIGHLADSWDMLEAFAESSMHIGAATVQSGCRMSTWKLLRSAMKHLVSSGRWFSINEGDRHGTVKANLEIKAAYDMLRPFGKAAAEKSLVELPIMWLDHMDVLCCCCQAVNIFCQGKSKLPKMIQAAQAKKAVSLGDRIGRRIFMMNSQSSVSARRWARVACGFYEAILAAGYSEKAGLDATMHCIVPPWHMGVEFPDPPKEFDYPD